MKKQLFVFVSVSKFKRFKFVSHAVIVISSQSRDILLAVFFRRYPEDSSTPLGMTEVQSQLRSASLDLVGKFGNCRASSLLSAYCMSLFLLMMNAERLGTPLIPRFICGRNELYITPCDRSRSTAAP